MFRCFNTGFTQQQPRRFFALVLLCFTGWFFNPFFPRGGVGCFPMCSQKFVKQTIFDFHRQFFRLSCMSSIFLGRRPDGSSLILARPHGAPTRVGTVRFRSIFFALGPDRRIRSCILLHLGQLDWRHLRNSNARLLLLFEYSSASAVQSPQVQRVRAPGSPAVSSGPSVSSDSIVSSSDSSNESQ